MLMRRSPGRRLRTALPLLAALVVLGPLGWMWASSFVPSEYTATEMGYVDDGGVPVPGGHDHGDSSGGVPVASLTGDVDGPADVAVTLVARQERFRLATGEEVDGYTLNGTLARPDPARRAGEVAGGAAGQRVRRRRYHAALARGRRAERRRRCGRRDPGRGARGRQPRLPLPAGARGDVLVPRPPALPRAGRARVAGRAGRRPAGHGRRRGHRRRRAHPPLRRAPHRGRAHRRRAGAGRARQPRPDPRDQHRQRPDPHVGRRRAVPGAGRRRHRRPRAHPGQRHGGRRHRRWAGGPRGGSAGDRCGPRDGRRGVGAGRRAVRRPGAAAVPATGGRRGPAALRHPGAARVRPGDRGPQLLLRHRPPPGLRRRPSRAVVDGERAPVPGHADVHRGAGRRRADAHHQHQRRGAPDAPARPPDGGARAGRGGGVGQPVVGRLAGRRRR